MHTWQGEDAHRIDALLDLGSSRRLGEGARELRQRGVQATLWACTSGSFVYGWEGAARQVDELSQAVGTPASSTSFAFVDALRALGLQRVQVAATYPADVADSFVEFLHAGGIDVIHLQP